MSRAVVIVLSLMLASILAISVLIPGQLHQPVTYAQPPTATAECLGECRAARTEVVEMGDATTFNVRGRWPGIPRPCIKDGTGINEDSRHMVAVAGTRTSFSGTTNERIEIGYIKATWGGGNEPYLYWYCSFCGTPFGFPLRYDDLISPVEFRMEVDNSTNPKTIKWYYTNDADNPLAKEEPLEMWPPIGGNTISFTPYAIIAGAYSTDTRNDIGIHTNKDIQYKIGSGSYTAFSPSPSNPWQGYYHASGVDRYYNHLFESDSTENKTDVHYGLGESLCP